MKNKPKYNMWQNAGYMIREAWLHKKSVLALCLAAVALAVTSSVTELYVTPVLLSKVESAASLGALLGTIGGFAAAIILLRGLSAYVDRNTMFGRIVLRVQQANHIVRKMAVTSYANLLNPDFLKKYAQTREATNSNDSSAEAIWNTLTALLQNGVGFLIYLCLLSSLHPLLLAVIVATTAAGYLVSKRINEWGFRHREESEGYIKELHYIQGKSEDQRLAKDIRMFGIRPWLEELYAKTMRLYRGFIRRRESTYLWANLLDIALTFLRSGIAYWYLISLTLGRGLPASEFLLYFSAVSGFTAWITGILEHLTTLHQQSLELSSIREFLEYPEPFSMEGGKSLPRGPYEITLEHVSFRYPEGTRDTIHDLNLNLRAGEKLAVVGLNGAGKTTLVKLICGFLDPTEGRVLLNGQDIRDFNRREYYGLFSAVFQSFSVLEATVAENVAQSVEGFDRERVSQCLAQAGLSKKIDALPKGMDTHIGRKVFPNGVELSGGQLQRLMLARALYKDAPLLVLDEPTAALDPIAESDIYRKYSQMTAGRTSLFISHRLASTRFCDRIIFLAEGAIAEEGTHEALLRRGGGYAELFRVQSQYYQKEAGANEG